MKKWKKILQNCPYLSALLITWLFMTAGSIGLMIYRDYGAFEKSSIFTNPFFAIIMEEEMHGRRDSAYADKPITNGESGQGNIQSGQGDDKISPVIPSVSGNGVGTGAFENMIINAGQAAYANIEDADAEGSNEAESAEGDTEIADIEESNDNEDVNKKVGETLFVSYTPVETNSIYYTDAGKFALTTEYDYTKADEDYFEEAVFFGDSRTLGIADYAKIKADFYCESGMTIYKLLGDKGVKNPKTGEKANLNNVLQQKKYGKIYIMLGMNELGYGNTERFYEKYKEVVEQIREWQPQAVIFIMANLHVSREKNDYSTYFNNININDKNAAIANLADGVNVFYLDCNPLFVDEGGFLRADLTFDGVHLYANSYSQWREFLMEHGVVKREENMRRFEVE